MSASTKLPLLLALALLAEGEPNWLARALARTDPDVDAAVLAYEDADYELALEHLDAAAARRGERPEIDYDRGLARLATGDQDGARTAFQRGTESDVTSVVASSRYQLGNLAMLGEDWETAISEYSACLRAQPDHQNAKWNLEIALLRKREQEKKEQEEQEKNQDQQNQDQQNQDQQNQDQQNQDQQNQDQQNQDQQNQDQQNQDQQNQDQQKQDQQKQDPQEQDQQKQDPQKQDPQKQDPQKQDPAQPEQAQAKPIETGDLDAALDQLDRQDQFMLGRPRGSRRPVEKDW